MNSPWYKILLALSLLAALGGIVSLWPASGASYPNVMGYRSVCTFAPAASLYCFAIAGISCFLRASMVKEREGSPGQRIEKHAKALVILISILALALASTFWFVGVKSRYAPVRTDAGSAASAQE